MMLTEPTEKHKETEPLHLQYLILILKTQNKPNKQKNNNIIPTQLEFEYNWISFLPWMNKLIFNDNWASKVFVLL